MARKSRPRTTSTNSEPLDSRRRNLDLDEIDLWMRRAYDQIKKELDAVDAQLQELEDKRAELAARAEKLALGLGLGVDNEIEDFDPEPPPVHRSAPQPATVARKPPRHRALASSPRPQRRRRRRKHGALWQDVADTIRGEGAIQASEIIQRLVASGYEDNENLRTRVYNSLGRWAREGKLSKRGRGMYELEDE